MKRTTVSWLGGAALLVAAGLVWILFTDNSPVLGWMFVAAGAAFIGVGAASARKR